ncbi:MAG: deoxyribonuclease HsdR, partial [Tannerella sp.]|nr:deoxyribonuclease HsdR [Tannerella sp.]
MNKFWKNLMYAALIVLISGAVAAAVTAHVIKGQTGVNPFSTGDDGQSAFKHPLQEVMYTGVAAENTDFTYAAEKTIHAVVHIEVSATVSSRGRGGDDYFDPFEWFFGPGNGYRDRQPRQPQQRKGLGSGVIISTDG